jgi:hypothetical protein
MSECTQTSGKRSTRRNVSHAVLFGVVYHNIAAVRGDLVVAHQAVWQHVGRSGDWWTGAQRREAATISLAAFVDQSPTPPWVAVSDRFDHEHLSPSVVDAVYRMTAHAHTLTEPWYRALITDGLDEPAYVELCGIVSSVAAVASLARTLGSTLPEFPDATSGAPRRPALELGRSPRNWVPVIAPGGQRAAVVEAFGAAPGEFALLWDVLAPAQYIADEEMVDLAWTRGTLSRPQIELVAARVAALRQCFF